LRLQTVISARWLSSLRGIRRKCRRSLATILFRGADTSGSYANDEESADRYGGYGGIGVLCVPIQRDLALGWKRGWRMGAYVSEA
jgi:hypothetical protein